MSTTTSSPYSDWLDSSTLASRYHATAAGTPQSDRRARSKVSSSIASAEMSLEELTERDEFAFLASIRAQRLHDFIYSNNESSKESRERLDTVSDFANNLKKEQTMNLAAWEIIDREITEWQNVCSTGRPSWWSPVAKRNRRRPTYVSYTEDPSKHSEETKLQIVSHEEQPSESRRARAMSDSSLPNTTRLHDLAYLIAVQLLSACFTLPPEHIPEIAPSSYHYYTSQFEHLPDPELISALRMHTHFRFSPGFGHHARNNSRVNNLWASFQDGRCTPAVISSLQFRSPGNFKPDSRVPKSKRRIRRALNTTEVSTREREYTSWTPTWTGDGPIDPSEIPLSATETAWNRRKGVKNSNSDELPPQGQKRINISLPPSPSTNDKAPHGSSKSIYTHRHRSSDVNCQKRRSKQDHATQTTKTDERQTPKYQGESNNSRSLESQIRSEPHPVFVQPVKELVTKKWRTFRHRFGHSSSSSDPSSTSNDFIEGNAQSGDTSPGHSQYVGNLRLASPPGMFTPGSIVSNTSDGKERRRRARKASQINSGSSNEEPRFNTPMSEEGRMYDGLVAAMDVHRASPTIQLLDPLSATPGTIDSARSNSLALPSPLRSTSTDIRSKSVSSYSPKGGPSAPIWNKNSRKSMLSEMHTHDTYQPTSIEMSEMSPRPPLSIAGSAIASQNNSTADVDHDNQAGDNTAQLISLTPSSPLSPGIDNIAVPFDDATPGPDSTPLCESPFVETPGSVFVDWSAGNVREQAVKQVMQNELLKQRTKALESERMVTGDRGEGVRPRMVRMSTSGTQCFTPSEDGVEIDGMPVGPGLDEAGWNIEEKKRKGKSRLKEGSFL